MKLLTPAQMNEVDRLAAQKYGILGVLLMEHAAWKVFEYLQKHYPKEDVVIICGPGNNGGDGFALARQVRSFTKNKVKVWMAAPAEKLSQDGKTYYEICRRLNIDIEEIAQDSLQDFKKEIMKAPLVIDALFGTGLNRAVEGIYKEIIETINTESTSVVSIDIPSGIDGTSGKIQGICVNADATITFMAPKTGLFLYPGCEAAGRLEVANIGIPYELIENTKSQIYGTDQQEMAGLLPVRPVRSNKGTFGKVLTIGGSLGMSGAISLTSLAAYKAGCGTVTTAVPGCIIKIMQQKLTEVMAVPVEDHEGFFGEGAAEQIKGMLDKYDVIAIGPGIGRKQAVLEVLKVVLKSEKPCVIDADALYFIPEVLELLKARKAPVILTPHPGEMARITGKKISEVLEKPLKVAKDFANEFSVVLVLKIEKTVIADWSGNIYINRYGNPGLAKGGSGDTLTGIITGLMAQHLAPCDAARLGVYLQTRAADLAKDELSQYSYLASDTINYLSHVFKELIDC